MGVLDYIKLSETDPFYLTAYHEAGHAAMYLLLGLGINYVEIHRTPNNAEGIVKPDNTYPFNPDNEIKAIIAGPAAERILCKLTKSTVGLMIDWPNFVGDYKSLCQLCPRIGYQRRYGLQVDKVLREKWSLVEAIAQQLLEKQYLTGIQLEKLFEDHNQEHKEAE